MLTTKDSGDALAKKLDRKLAGFAGRVGVAGIFNPELATRLARHEFGDGVPKRPSLGPATDAAYARMQALADRQIGAVVDLKRDPDVALEVMAEELAEGAQHYIELGKVGGPPLSAQAKRNDPRKLIDTGDMVKAIEGKARGESEVG